MTDDDGSAQGRPELPPGRPGHPPLAAALLMIGIVVFLVLVAVVQGT